MTFIRRLLTLLSARWFYRRAKRKLKRKPEVITNYRLWKNRRPF